MHQQPLQHVNIVIRNAIQNSDCIWLEERFKGGGIANTGSQARDEQ